MQMPRQFPVLFVLCAACAHGAVFAPTEGHFGISLPYVPPPSALDLRVDGDALGPLMEASTNRVFTARQDPRLTALADHFQQGNLPMAAMTMENIRGGSPPGVWSQLPLGDVYYEMGWYAQAVEFCEQALTFKPDLDNVRRVLVASLIQARRGDAAVAAARKYTELRGDDAVAHYLLARALYATGRTNAAMDAVSASLARDDRRPDSWLMKAQLLFESKQPREAIEAATRCQRVAGAGNAEVALLLGRAFAALNDRRQAEAFLREAARGAKPRPEALLALAAFLEDSNRGEAIATLERAVADHPASAPAHAALAKLYAASMRSADAARERSAAAYYEGRIDDALEAALDAIGADPARPDAYVKASSLLQQRGEWKASETMAAKARARFPDDAAVAVRLARVTAAGGRIDEALRLLEEAPPAVKDLAEVRIETARLHAGRKDFARALAIVEPLMAEAASAEIFRLAGNWRLELGRADAARDAYARGLRIAPLNPAFLNGFAYAAMTGGAPAGDLLPLARKAAELAPDDAAVADTLGWVLAESGRAGEAVHVLRGVAARLPDNLSAQYHFALACARDGRAEEAAGKLREVLATGKPFPEQDAARALLGQVEGRKK